MAKDRFDLNRKIYVDASLTNYCCYSKSIILNLRKISANPMLLFGI